MLTDDELLKELDIRFKANKKSLRELNKVMRELKNVNQKLETSESLKSQFLSNIKNEFNNPIASILGLSNSLLNSSGTDEATMKSMAKLIYKEAFSLDFQLNNIFTAAEVEAGEAIPEFMSVNVSQIINSLISTYAHILDKKKIHVETNITLDEIIFITDSAKVNLILSNIVGNAIEFSNPENKLIIEAYKNDEGLTLSVQDFGIGIDQSDQERIFDRFVQLDSGTTKAHGGHGIGLSVTKALLEILNGKIELTSELNKGSKFTIFIPRTEIEFSDDMSSDANEFLFDADETF